MYNVVFLHYGIAALWIGWVGVERRKLSIFGDTHTHKCTLSYIETVTCTLSRGQLSSLSWGQLRGTGVWMGVSLFLCFPEYDKYSNSV